MIMANDNEGLKIDNFSFQLGMINCFIEMVACGVKRMAISPPLSEDDYARIQGASEKIVSEFGMSSYLEKSLLITDLQTEDFTRGKWLILYYRDEATLEAYHGLKSKKQQLEKAGAYDEAARKGLSREFMRLLSYPDDVIDAKLSQAAPSDPYVLTESGEES
jgi:hypothetical protein